MRNRRFYVADFPLYTVRRGKPVFALARHTKEHPHNLVLVHLFDKQNSSYDQLKGDGYFRPNPDEAQAVLDAADTLTMEMSGLRLSADDKVDRFLRVRTRDGFVGVGEDKYTRPNEVEQAFIQRVGYTEEFLDVLGSKPHGVSETRIHLLNPDYVTAEAGELFVGRAAWRYNFLGDAGSVADGRLVDCRRCLRGVRRIVAPQGRAPENDVPQALPEIRTATMEDILAFSHGYVPPELWPEYSEGIRERLSRK